MIIVSGTMRSGTSMWMRALQAAGFVGVGSMFPGDWGESPLKDANPGGFFESTLRHGIYYATNPHPQTGIYLPHGAPTKNVVIKIFPEGLLRTHRGFIDHVVVTVRGWRQYAASRERLFALDAARIASMADAVSDSVSGTPDLQQVATTQSALSLVPAPLEWFVQNTSLLLDLEIRRFPHWFKTYDDVVINPSRHFSEVIGALGGNVEAAVAAVDETLQTQRESPTPPEVSAADEALYDDLYAHLAEGRSATGPFLASLRERYASKVEELRSAQARRRSAMLERQ